MFSSSVLSFYLVQYKSSQKALLYNAPELLDGDAVDQALHGEAQLGVVLDGVEPGVILQCGARRVIGLTCMRRQRVSVEGWLNKVQTIS